jgi:hypothetical protein
LVERPFAEDERRDWLPDDRDRELPEPPLREAPEVRDAGGEDVRVAMRTRLRRSHTGHTLPTPTAAGAASEVLRLFRRGRRTPYS